MVLTALLNIIWPCLRGSTLSSASVPWSLCLSRQHHSLVFPPASKFCNQEVWVLQLGSSFSRLFWLHRLPEIPREFHNEFFHLWEKEKAVAILKGFHWIHRLLWVVLTFYQSEFFQSVNMGCVSMFGIQMYKSYKSFTSSVKLISKYVIAFDAIASWKFSWIPFQSDHY